MKLNYFKENAGIHPDLIQSTVKQIGGWQSFQERVRDIVNHGAQNGVSGFIYYTETRAFFQKNKRNIVDMVIDRAAECGGNFLEMITGLSCIASFKLNQNDVFAALAYPDAEYADQVENCLAWFALEEVAWRYCDLEDMEEDDS